MRRLIAIGLLVLLGGVAQAIGQPLGTAFTYQGRLVDGGNPATGSYDFQLVLFDAPVGGSQVGPIVVREDAAVSDGLFTLTLDFGASAFAGNARFLEVAVRQGASTGVFTPLAPRQPLTPSPGAIFGATAPWTGVLAKPAGFADDKDDDLLGGLACANGQVAKFNGTIWVCAADADSGGDITAVTAATGLTGGGTTGAVSLGVNPAVVQSRVAGVCAPGSSIRTVNLDGTVVCQLDGSPGAWSLTGNAGTSPATNFMGTTDAQPLELRVSGTRVLRLENVSAGGFASVNVLGGHPSNTVSAGITGATIAGGGLLSAGNQVTANFATVSGGFSNTASGVTSTVGGGEQNAASGDQSTVGGGDNNDATGGDSTVGGGVVNTASGGFSTVAGGVGNTASGAGSTVAGGNANTASSSSSTVAGGNSNSASGTESTVAGGRDNDASGSRSMVPGGQFNGAGGDFSFGAGRRADVRDAAQAGETGICTIGTNCGDEGTFIWADAQNVALVSTGPNQFLVRASGGLWFGTNSSPSVPAGRFINTTSGAHLTTGGVWTNASDAALKENFEPVDGADVLARLADLPITSWNYRAEDASTRHVGPTAQDFRAAFGLGADDTSISTIDPAGLALAAIQELHRMVQEQHRLTQDQRQLTEDLRSKVEEIAALQARLDALEARDER